MYQLFFFLTALFVIWILPVQAQEVSIGVIPSIIQIQISSNDAQTGKFLLKNTAAHSVDIDFAMVPFAMNEDGTVQIVENREKIWLSLSQAKLTIPANQEQYVTYVISIPPDTMLGSQNIMVFAQIGCKKQDINVQSPALCINTQIGIPFLIAQSQKITDMQFAINFDSLALLSASKQTSTKIQIKNTSSVFFHPHGSVSMTSLFGRKIAQVRILPQMVVLAHSVRKMEISLSHPQAFGVYHIVATIFDEHDNMRTVDRWVIRVARRDIWIPITLLVVTFVGYLWYRRKSPK